MTDRIERELQLDAPTEAVWEAMLSDGWLADEVRLELHPGGDASFRSADGERHGWIEDVSAPNESSSGRLAFWWAADDEPASRVELTIDAGSDGSTWVRVVETRPLEQLDLIGLPLRGTGGQTSYGPALVAA
ncbi:MAG TPA: SRPBCC domain-containing protein [Solirubrobacteraceae bacterium]|jgi:uncharacterized protein YndB with AHSA1/START domain|nr:SRPBCC domain-containing protein [Solirubrobacteraceae bacterium]